MGKVKKTYLVDFFVDTHIEENPVRASGFYMAQHYSVSECLHELLNEVSKKIENDIDDMEFYIGIHFIQTRPDAYLNKSYINKVIFDDDELWKWYYC